MMKPLHVTPVSGRSQRPFILRVSLMIGFLLVFILSVGCCLSQPTRLKSQPVTRTVNLARMREAVTTLSVDYAPRSYQDLDNLNRTAEYIFNQFKQAGGAPEVQAFTTSHGEYKNVRCIFGKGKSRRIVVGAHYDACVGTPGADDNASGVAGLIELAYLIGNDEACGEVELVAYSLEEPPFFRSNEMGSFVHAESLIRDQVDVQGAIILEMIGYFSDEPGSQDSPMLLLKMIYPSKGNYILVAGHTGQKNFTKQVKVGMKGATDLEVYSISASRNFPGIDFSDHLNYWRHNLDAVMVTDTAFFRNKAYHTAHDTADRLDYHRMGQTVLGVYSALINLRTPIMKTITLDKFPVPVDQESVSNDWKARGYSCHLFVDPPGREWIGFVHKTNELVTVLEGELELTVEDNVVVAFPGDEVFIPAGAVHSVKNIYKGTTRWFYGYD